MTLVLDGLLILALITTIFATSTTRGSWGPEGPVGALGLALIGALDRQDATFARLSAAVPI